MRVKGVYKWQLVNKDTGEVEGKGRQENLVTDSFLKDFSADREKSKTNKAGRIVLSTESVPLPSLEFREYGVATANISRDTVSGALSFVYDDPAGIRTCSQNFAPPGSPTTYTIFGCDERYQDRYGTYYYWEFVSFIVLTTPVTQLTTQYLYVEYEMYTYYSNALLDSPINNYIRDFFNINIYDRMKYLALNCGVEPFRFTPFRPPVTLNNLGRRVVDIGWFDHGAYAGPNYGCRYGESPQITLNITQMVGPIGVPVYMRIRNTSSPYESCLIGAFDNTDIVPSISRVYIHPATRAWYIFSDPSYGPSSRASITVTGTPTNKVPICMRLEITRTGDASDIVDETFTANPATDELTVSQDDWAVDDIVQFTTTGTLPAPLATSTDYYVVVKSGSSPTVLLEVSLSEGGASVDITDAGTGTHTLSRQNTGRYRLTMQPVSVLSINRSVGGIPYYQIIPMIDCDNEVMGIDDETQVNSGYGVIGKIGDYIHTVQYDASGNQLMICRQLIFTPECSTPLYSLFGTSGLTFYRVVRGTGTYSDIVYIGTSVGIYSYDLSSPATPTFMSITGMLSSDVRDLAFDEITEYLWAGHYRGMSRIDLSTNTATQYDNGSGDPLYGISDTYIECRPGSLTAYSGRVLRTMYNQDQRWLLEDGVGYCYVSSWYGSPQGGGLIDKSTGYLVFRSYYSWRIVSVTGITGPGTGSWVTLYVYDPGVNETGGSSSHILDMGNGRYRAFVEIDNVVFMETYEFLTGFYTRASTYGAVPSYNGGLIESTIMIANGRVPLDVSEGDMDLPVQLVGRYMLSGSWGEFYGWTGSAWEKWNANDRQIIKTGTHSLSQGISVAFNNAVGENWDDQFVLGEFLTFMISPTLIKDNLQEYTIKGRVYHCYVKRVDNWTTTIAANITVPEAPTGSAPDPNYRDLDFDPVVLEVYNVTSATYMTQVSSPPGDEEYSVVGLLDGTFEFHANQIGDSVRISYNYTCYY